MERAPQNKHAGVDRLSPIPPTVQPSGCFGKAWDLTAKECGLCHDSDLCSILCNKANDSTELAQGQYLSDFTPELITAELVSSILEDLRRNGKELTSNNLLEDVVTLSNSPGDVMLVVAPVKAALKELGLKVSDGLIVNRDE